MSFLVNPFALGSYVPPTTNAVFAVQDFASGSATGNLDVTSSTITGLTPKAVISIGVNQSASNSTETAEAILSLGWGTDSQGPGSIGIRSRDNQASTSCVTISDTVSTLRQLLSSSASSNDETANSSMISGGNRFNFGSNDATDRRGVNIYFAGTDVSAHKGQPSLGTGTSALDQTGPNFQPDVVFFMNNGDNGVGTLTAAFFSFGICVRNNHSGGGVVQRALIFVEDTAQAAGRAVCTIDTSCVGGQMTYGSATYKFTCGNFDSQGFDITPTANAGSDAAFYLALKLTDRKIKLVDFTTPTSTGNWSISGVGFLPQCAIAVLTNLEALDTYESDTTNNQSGFSINLIGTDEQWANSIRMDSGADPTDTASNCQNVALLGPSATACDAIKATLVGFNTDGMTLNFSAVQGTGKKGFILFIE